MSTPFDELQLRAKERTELYEKIIANSPVGIATYTSDGQIVSGNEAMAAIIGATLDQLLQQNFRELTSWKISGLAVAAESVLATGVEERKQIHVETTFGIEVWLDCQLSRFVLNGVPHLLLTAADITSSKKAEIALQHAHDDLERLVRERTSHLLEANEQLRLEIAHHRHTQKVLEKNNRALRALSECDSQLLRATEETELMNAVCRIVTQTAGYRMAWVGLALDDEAKTVQPVAEAGFEEGYLETLKITWADTERGQGPTGVAIRTSIPRLARDISTDPLFTPWREQGIKRGYRSSIALPLINERRTFGMLGVYASEPDAFDDEEVALLKKLADNLSYGIEALRVRKARTEAESERDRLFNLSVDMLCTAGFDGFFKQINPSWSRTLGWTEEELLSRPYLEFVHPMDRPGTVSAMEMLGSGITVNLFENRYACKDGTYKWISWNSTPLLEEEIVFAVARDITEHKDAEDALRESEEKFSKAFRNSPEAITITAAADGRLIEVNEALLSLSGYSRDDVIGRTSNELNLWANPDDRDAYVAALRTNGRVVGLETKFRTKTDDLRTCVLSGELIEIKGRPCILGVIQDITERKREQEILRRRADELNMLNLLGRQVSANLLVEDVVSATLQGMERPLGPALALIYVRADNEFLLIKVQPDSTTHRTNEAQIRLGECLCGLAVKEKRPIFSEDIYADPRCTLDDCKRAGMRSFAALPLSIEETVVGVLGLAWTEVRSFEEQMDFLTTSAHWVAIGLQNALYYEGTLRQAEELEQKVKERTIRLETANKELESFSYSVSHDLRAPLRAISGFAEIITRRYKESLNEEARHYFDNIVQAGTRMGALIDDLLKYSRLGRQSVLPRPLNLGEVLAGVIDTFAESIRESRAQVVVPENLPVISGDQTLLTQIFTNLLQNALTYRQPNVYPLVVISCHVVEHDAIIGLKDNGVGIAPQYHDKIFNVFQRLHGQDDYPGTGIGLAIVKKSAELMGGTVWVDSALGQGSTFFVKLPCWGNK